MTKCTDTKLGTLLHAYELNVLNGQSRDALEEHLLGCDFCFQEISRFADIAGLLRADEDVRGLAERHSEARATGDNRHWLSLDQPASAWATLRRYFWPDAPTLLKPVFAYALVLLLIQPAYQGFFGGKSADVQGVPSILLTGTRAGATAVKADLPLVVMFRIDGAKSGETFRVTVRSDGGKTLYSTDQFTDFNNRQLGTLFLPEEQIHPGRFTIRVFRPGESTPLREYTFSVE